MHAPEETTSENPSHVLDSLKHSTQTKGRKEDEEEEKKSINHFQ